MAKRPALSDITNILTSSTILNSNWDAIQAAFDNTLSRDGSTPNQMEADIDLNSNDLLNVKNISLTGDITLDGTGLISSIETSESNAAASATAAASSAADSLTQANRAEDEADQAAISAGSAAAAIGKGLFETVADLLADTNVIGYTGSGATYIVNTGDIVEAGGFRYEVAASGASDEDATTAGGVKLYDLQRRTAKAAAHHAAKRDGDVIKMGGLLYEVDSSATGASSATNDLGVDGLVPHGQWYFEHFGCPVSPTDCQSACQAAIDATATGRRIMFAATGPYRTTGPIYLKKSDMQITGPNGGDAEMEYVNAAGGTVFAGDEDEDASLAAYARCKIEGIRLLSVDAATDPSRVVDLTSFSYGYFYVKGQTKRTDAEWYYGQGNAGIAPYWNTIIIDGVFGGDGAGGTNYTQTALRFAQGAWAGGSNGGNANTIRCQGRAAALRGVIDIQSGTGNMVEVLNGEVITDWYVRLNFNPSVESGTSSGSNGQLTLIDTSKSWTANEFLFDAVKITGGTGAGQVRIISTNSGTTLNLKEPWGIVPDATSTYEIYESKASGNQISLSRAEGQASLNPDFIQAHPGTTKTNFAFSEVQSIGSGLFVRDDSGSSDNNWFNGDKLVFTHTFENPGPSANLDAYPRVGVFGGVKVPGTYVVEWLKVNNSYTGSGDVADVRLDVGGTAPGNGDMTLHAQMPSDNTIATAFPAEDEKISRDGTNRSLFLNLQTGASFSATVDVQATFCISLS